MVRTRRVGQEVLLQGQWGQAVAGNVSADGVVGADWEVGEPLGD